MIVFSLIFACVVLFFFFLLVEDRRVKKLAIVHGYGLKSQISGKPCLSGQLVCVSVNAPTLLNKTLSYDYAFHLYTDGINVTGTYKYQPRKAVTYAGEVFLSLTKNRVKGRSGGGSTFEGVTNPNGVSLNTVSPPGRFLTKILEGSNKSYEYKIRSGQIQFGKPFRGISTESMLRIDNNRLHGRVFHWPQKSWAVDVNVTYQGIKSEVVSLAVVLACNDILQLHHD